jgi:acetoin utilization protein AcuC
MPEQLPDAAQSVLAALEWDRRGRKLLPEPHWITTLRDAPRTGPISAELRERLGQLEGRLRAWV